MNPLFAGSIVLSLASLVGNAFAQAEIPPSALHIEEQRQMAPNWRSLGKTHNATVFIHHSIKKTDNGYLVWIHHELPYPEYVEKEKAYLSMRERVLVDCKSSKTGTLESAYYPERFGAGAVVATSKAKRVEMSEALPDSIEEQLIKTSCEPKPHNKPGRKSKVMKKVKAAPGQSQLKTL